MLDLDRALLRGTYAVCVAMMARIGVPIDMVLLGMLMARWQDLRERIAARAAFRYPGVFEGTTLVEEGFRQLIDRRGYWWPTLPDGGLKLDGETFDEMIDFYPEFRFLRDTRWMLRQTAKLKIVDYIGVDGRNHVASAPFSAKTGRDGHSTSKSVLAAPTFLRSIIQARPGFALLYADFKAEEYALMARLSKCPGMLAAYDLAKRGLGDVYFEFAKAARAVLPDALRKDHEEIREIYKTVVLAVAYGQGALSLGRRLKTPSDYAQRILDQFNTAYPECRDFGNRVYVTSQMRGRMRAELGWKMWVTPLTNEELSIKNWPIQACAAEILKVAVVLAFRRGIRLCGALHDAVLVECREQDVDSTTKQITAVMQEASANVLGGFELAVDVKAFAHPDHFHDKRGVDTWNEIREALGWT
ncbi:MAG: hypothetical protein BGO98_29665 [Myxococcales bacterium 68-20]|nr:MAG: hypothetical protein BGO98_29665 [Myxococcales bacterium 68-20]